ncbi:hypothetical protein GDO81_021380 [Engystomops pustulosus]|uniref:Ig-like domain-containing protein n=1 Tax=Engystomops pustulosus TaxID=76066 RepID=A0AAV6Z6N8_ENGPU|nr:hypothetical protein GDO81_021380 [Engystomops pustulosus]
MMSHFDSLQWTFCLFVLPGYFTDSQQGNWTFTFPHSIETMIHSTVDIPCSFTGPNDPKKYHLIWYEYGVRSTHQQVYNSDNQSQVHPDYINRTSLIGGGANCSLRIKNMTKTAWYFPEITSSNSNNEQKPIKVNVTGCLNRPTCSDWSFSFPRTIKALNGSCVEIPCTLTSPENVTDFNLIWFLRTPTGDIPVYNNRTRLRVDRRYRGRTSLVRMKWSSCSLRINDVTAEGQFYPGINREINAFNLDEKFCTVKVTDLPMNPEITGTENLTDSSPVNLTCSVTHTCLSNRPSLRWNIHNNQNNSHKVNLTRGNWKEQSDILYIPSIKDHNTSLECKATFPNGLSIVQRVTLFIEDPQSDSGPDNLQNSVIAVTVFSGIICLLLLLLVVFIYKRMKRQRTTVMRRMGETQEPTYADLERSTMEEDYAMLKTNCGGDSAMGHETEPPDYENILKTSED